MDGLRHDGLYRSTDQFDRLDQVWYWFYLWFRSGGEVDLVVHTGTPEEAAVQLRGGVRPARGQYRVDGGRVSGRIEDGGAGIRFEGSVAADRLELQADDGIGFFPSSDVFEFIEVAVPG